MTNYTATDGTVITVTQIVTTQGNQGIYQASYAGLTSPSGLADKGYSTSVEMAIANLYQAAHSRQLSGATPDISTHSYR
jgi:hypothetical protein